MSDNLFIDVATLRAALFDVLDSESPMWRADIDSRSWRFNHKDESPQETRQRGLFVDAVVKRAQTLRSAPFNLGIKLENYCPRHIKLRLPDPTATYCTDCEKELREKL